MYIEEIKDNPKLPERAGEDTESTVSLTAKITYYLRWSGVILIVLSAISFMLQGHADMLPAYRYWVGFAFTLLLCAGGLICAYWLKENKGARIFFALGAGFLPVQTSQVGAMIYGYMHGDQALQPKYNWLQFMDVSPSIIFLDCILTAVLLVLVSYAGFSILARKHLKPLMQATIIGNLMLLIPFREGNWVAMLIAGLFVYLWWIEKKLYQDSSMSLLEGLAARILIALPLLIILGRSLMHPSSYLLALTVSIIIAVISIHDVKRYTENPWVLYASQWLGTLAAMATWLIVIEHFVGFSFELYNVLLPLTLILFILSEQVTYHAKGHRTVSTILAVILSYGAMFNDQTLAPILALAVGIALTVAGLRYKEKIPFFCGNVSFVGGVLFYCKYAVEFYNTAPWITSIGLGLVVILLASFLEKREAQLLSKAGSYYNEIKQWS